MVISLINYDLGDERRIDFFSINKSSRLQLSTPGAPSLKTFRPADWFARRVFLRPSEWVADFRPADEGVEASYTGCLACVPASVCPGQHLATIRDAETWVLPRRHQRASLQSGRFSISLRAKQACASCEAKSGAAYSCHCDPALCLHPNRSDLRLD